MKKRFLTDMYVDELKAALGELSEPRYRAAQIFDWIYKKNVQDLSAMRNLPKALQQKLDGQFIINPLVIVEDYISHDGTHKYLFQLQDKGQIESVMIPSKDRNTLCLSTQAGCRFRCSFCASGAKGFIRDLMPSEIIGQILHAAAKGGDRITNLVFMGMGEPLDNYENVTKAIRIINSDEAFNIAARRMTISTVGIVPGIRRLAGLGIQVNLSISLHATDDETRDRLVPVNRKYPLKELLKAAKEYFEKTGRQLTLEYILLKGINDSADDAKELARIARDLRASINLLAYHRIEAADFPISDRPQMQRFLELLKKEGAHATIRSSRGSDINAACGQLAGKRR